MPGAQFVDDALKATRSALKQVDVKRPSAKARVLADQVDTPLTDLGDEALDIMSADLRQFDQSASHQINFDTITTTDEIKATIGQVAENNKGSINKARRETITHEMLRGLANDLSLDVDVVGKVLQREAGEALNAETILASRQVLNQSALRLRQLAKKVTSATASDKEKLAFRRQFQWHSEYQRQFMGARAEAGRALNAFNIPVGTDDLELARLNELVDNVHGGDLMTMAELVTHADSLQGINKATREFAQSKMLGVVQELFINSVLSGIKTHVVNTTGNFLFQSMNVAETAVAARIGRMLPGEDHVQIGEASAMMYGLLSGFKDAMRVAWKGLKKGVPEDAVSKFETPIRKAISAENFGLEDSILGPAVDFMGSVIRFPTERMLTTEDEFAKTLLYRSALAQHAYRDASRKFSAGEIDDVADYIRQYLDNPPATGVEAAQDFALYGTFQNPLGPNGQRVQGVVNRVPGLKLIAPFIRTPTNIFKAGFAERSPLGIFSSRIREQIAKGGPERDLALARLSMGSLTVASVAAAVGGGYITGGGPSNPQARKLLEATRWQPYSIAVTNPITGEVVGYQSYARAEPLAFVIGATADAVEILSHADFDDELTPAEEQAMELTSAIVAGVAENTMSKTFLSGVADFIQVMDDPERYLEGWLDNMSGAMVPFSGTRRDISRIDDPLIRQSWTLAEKLRRSSGIPGWSEELPPALDMFGEPRKYQRGAILGPLSPFPDRAADNDPVKLELVRLMDETNAVPVTMPGKRIEGMRLSSVEYHNLVRLSRKTLEIAGMTFMEQLESVIDSDLYQDLGEDGRLTLIRQVQRTYDKAARGQLELDSQGETDGLAERLDRHRAIKNRREFGELLEAG